MISDASQFIQHRKDTFSITNKRITQIISYVCECYEICVKDKTVAPYSISTVAQNSTLTFEDFLKFDLIDNYLNVNKHLFKEKVTELEEIHFSAETQERYIDLIDSKQKPDKIDIYVDRLGLQDEWMSQNNQVYFAIECKRIKILSDTKAYIGDIKKVTNRNHTNLRLPFEGQIAFIENIKLDHTVVAKKANTILSEDSEIHTLQYLKFQNFHSTFKATYSSIHTKNFGRNESFLVYHLLLDYTKIVMS
ncbi:hypothetical protein JoomaDRAFT_3973 [Galbibacter orientalis DSM 19592]|uniref:Uncharacterized protein n=1 Tax=Galbibacter orientalis DSM 19592 TaxID=926559 RepID=I3CBA3_9FLAO|nr:MULTISPECIES: hypothetical protein [Flavobacteriaceae]EIJ40896.1 hypothetical protein JoomaDRAFT_3973 [Galbibacter orientalis DSM 19592]